MDVVGLNRDSKVEVRTRKSRNGVVPVYWVLWRQPCSEEIAYSSASADGMTTIASVFLVYPERCLLQLRVESPRYIMRKPLVVPNRDRLLQETEDATMRQMWFTTEAYKEAASRVLLKEINYLCSRLGTGQSALLQKSNLTEISIATPFVSDHLGRFGGVTTKTYAYGASAGNKVSWISLSYRDTDESRYLAEVKAKYSLSKAQLNTNAAYQLATQWLAAASVDVQSLERDYTAQTDACEIGGCLTALYRVEWTNAKQEVGATVELVEPARQLKLLWVEKPEYIRRAPLVVSNRDALLSLTNQVPGVSAPPAR